MPSKTYSSLAAGRPLLASIDPGTEVTRVVAAADCGVSVRPDDADAFTAAVESLVSNDDGLAAMGSRGRAWVERWVSAAAVAEAYEALFDEVRHGNRWGPRPPRRAR